MGVDDDGALQELIDGNHRRLVTLLRLRGCGPEDADDLAQEALLRLVERWSASPDVENWWAWLAKVAINLQVSHWRRLSTAVRRGHLVGGPSEYRDAETVETLDLLGHLSERQRTAVLLRYYAGLSVQETAEAMGVAPGTVKSLSAAGRASAREATMDQEAVT